MISIEGFVLAGGQSSRMGRDKASLQLGGQSLVERSAKTLSRVVTRVTVVGDLDDRTDSRSVVPDIHSGTKARGSIVGLYSALYHSTTDWSAVLACDLPFANPELFSYLISHIPHGCSVTESNIGALLLEQPDGRVQPLCGLYRRERCLAPLKEMLDQGKWRLQDLPNVINAKLIRFADISHLPVSDHFFDNLNTPDEYLAALATENGLKTKDI